MKELVHNEETLDMLFELLGCKDAILGKVPNYNGYFVIEGVQSNSFVIKQACNIRQEKNGTIRMEYLTRNDFAVVFVWAKESISINYTKFGSKGDNETLNFLPGAHYNYYIKNRNMQGILEFPIDEMLFLVYNNSIQHIFLQDKVIGTADGFYFRRGKESDKFSFSFTLSLVGDLFNEN